MMCVCVVFLKVCKQCAQTPDCALNDPFTPNVDFNWDLATMKFYVVCLKVSTLTFNHKGGKKERIKPQ